jgi:hypothetical protein
MPSHRLVGLASGRGARQIAAALLLLAALGVLPGPAAEPFPAAPSEVVRVEDLIGMWIGEWVADGGAAGGSLEMILARDPADRQALVAQVTFVDGAQSDTVRREGRLTRTGVFFGLVGGGAMVLTLEPGPRLAGEFAGGPCVPVRRGSLELARKS